MNANGINLNIGGNTNNTQPNNPSTQPDNSPETARQTMPPAESATDINEQDVFVSDQNAPIVVIFGPYNSGKSMTIVRLSQYLRSQGYQIQTDPTFRGDAAYDERCRKFNDCLATTTALEGNGYRDFLLAKVSKNGRVICQFLEAPGEDYFKPGDNSVKNFPAYMQRLFHATKNRKIWIFMTEYITESRVLRDTPTRLSYIDRIGRCMNQLVRPNDRFIVMYNKVDANDRLYMGGRLLVEQAEREMLQHYPGIHSHFINHNPLSRMWNKYRYKFVPFSTGTYNEHRGQKLYTPSDDRYPAYLWAKIMESIRG